MIMLRKLRLRCIVKSGKYFIDLSDDIDIMKDLDSLFKKVMKLIEDRSYDLYSDEGIKIHIWYDFEEIE